MDGPIGRWVGRQLVRPVYTAPPAATLDLVADDGTRVHAVRLAGPAGAVASIVLVHGITNSSRTPNVHAFANQVSTWAHVVVPDLRGHGRSGGACTLGELEPLDVAAAAVAARAAAPELPVVLVGTSLGGLACVLAAARAAVREAAGIVGVVAISAPAYREFERKGSARMFRWCSTGSGRLFVRVVFRTRIKPGWQLPDDVQEETGLIAPAFTVIAHDPAEPYFGPGHAEALHAWAAEPKALWWLPGAGHGGMVLTPEFAARLRDDVTARVRG